MPVFGLNRAYASYSMEIKEKVKFYAVFGIEV